MTIDLKLEREKLDRDAAWIAKQRASLDEIEAARIQAEAAIATAVEVRAEADALWAETDNFADQHDLPRPERPPRHPVH